MSKQGSTVRLIDIVLNLLFGFLMITDIIHKDQIKLPKLDVTQSRSPQPEKILPIQIHVLAGDTSMPEIDIAKEPSLSKIGQLSCYYLVSETDNIYHIRMLDKLEDHLSLEKAANESLTVIINPDSNSIVQGTINLIDICRRYDIKRKFKYE